MKEALKKTLFLTLLLGSFTTISAQKTTKEKEITTKKEKTATTTTTKKVKEKVVKQLHTKDSKGNNNLGSDKNKREIILDSKGRLYYKNKKGKKQYLTI